MADFPHALVTMWLWVTDDQREADRMLEQLLAPTLGRTPEELRDRVCIGSVERCADLLGRYAAVGCRRIHVWPLGDEAQQLERLMIATCCLGRHLRQPSAWPRPRSSSTIVVTACGTNGSSTCATPIWRDGIDPRTSPLDTADPPDGRQAGDHGDAEPGAHERLHGEVVVRDYARARLEPGVTAGIPDRPEPHTARTPADPGLLSEVTPAAGRRRPAAGVRGEAGAGSGRAAVG